MKFTKIKLLSALFVGCALVSVPTGLVTAELIKKNDEYFPSGGIKLDGKTFYTREAFTDYAKKNYGTLTSEIVDDKYYYTNSNGDRNYLSSHELEQVTKLSDKSKTRTIFSTKADIITHSNGVGELNPKWFDDNVINTYSPVKLWRGNSDIVLEDQGSALETYLNNGYEVYYFNDIYFQSKKDLDNYLRNIYFKNEQMESKSFRIKAPNGQYSKMINVSNKRSDWKSEAVNFIQQNCKKVLKVKTRDNKYKYITRYDEPFLQENVTLDMIPYFEVDVEADAKGQIKQQWVVGLNKADQFELSGPQFFSGFNDISKGFTNAANWTRNIGQGFTNYENELEKIVCDAINTFFGKFVESDIVLKGEGKDQRYESEQTLLFVDKSTGTRANGYSFKSNKDTIDPRAKIKVPGKHLGLEEDVEVSVRDTMAENIAVAPNGFSQISANLRDMYLNNSDFAEFSWIYQEALDAMNNYATMQDYNILIKVPLLYNLMMDRLITSAAPIPLLEETHNYFIKVANAFTTLVQQKLGDEAMQPMTTNKSDDPLNFAKIFGLDDKRIDFSIEVFRSYFVDSYPKFLTAISLYNYYSGEQYGKFNGLTKDKIIEILMDQLEIVKKSVYQDLSTTESAELTQSGRKILDHIVGNNGVLANPSAMLKASESMGSYIAVMALINEEADSLVSDGILDRVENEATELLNGKWELIPNDNRFKIFAYYLQEKTGVTYEPTDFLADVNIFNPASLIGWNNAFMQMEFNLTKGERYTDTGVINVSSEDNRIANVIAEKSQYLQSGISHKTIEYELERVKKMNENFKEVYLGDQKSSTNPYVFYSGAYVTFEEFVATTLMKMLGDLSEKDSLFVYDKEKDSLVISEQFKTKATKIVIDAYEKAPILITELGHLYRSFQSIQQLIDTNAFEYENIGDKSSQWGASARLVKLILQNTAQYASIMNRNMEYLQSQLTSIGVPLKTGQIIAYSGTDTGYYLESDLSNLTYEPNVKPENYIFSKDSNVATDVSSLVPYIDEESATYVIPHMVIKNGVIEDSRISMLNYFIPTKKIKNSEIVNHHEYALEKFFDVSLLPELGIDREVATDGITPFFDTNLRFLYVNEVRKDEKDVVSVRKWPTLNQVNVNPEARGKQAVEFVETYKGDITVPEGLDIYVEEEEDMEMQANARTIQVASKTKGVTPKPINNVLTRSLEKDLHLSEKGLEAYLTVQGGSSTSTFSMSSRAIKKPNLGFLKKKKDLTISWSKKLSGVQEDGSVIGSDKASINNEDSIAKLSRVHEANVDSLNSVNSERVQTAEMTKLASKIKNATKKLSTLKIKRRGNKEEVDTDALLAALKKEAENIKKNIIAVDLAEGSLNFSNKMLAGNYGLSYDEFVKLMIHNENNGMSLEETKAWNKTLLNKLEKEFKALGIDGKDEYLAYVAENAAYPEDGNDLRKHYEQRMNDGAKIFGETSSTIWETTVNKYFNGDVGGKVKFALENFVNRLLNNNQAEIDKYYNTKLTNAEFDDWAKNAFVPVVIEDDNGTTRYNFDAKPNSMFESAYAAKNSWVIDQGSIARVTEFSLAHQVNDARFFAALTTASIINPDFVKSKREINALKAQLTSRYVGISNEIGDLISGTEPENHSHLERLTFMKDFYGDLIETVDVYTKSSGSDVVRSKLVTGTISADLNKVLTSGLVGQIDNNLMHTSQVGADFADVTHAIVGDAFTNAHANTIETKIGLFSGMIGSTAQIVSFNPASGVAPEVVSDNALSSKKSHKKNKPSYWDKWADPNGFRKWKKTLDIAGKVGMAFAIFNFGFEIYSIISMVMKRPQSCYYSFTSEGNTWTWNGGLIYMNSRGKIDDSSSKTRSFAGNAKVNTPIRVSSTYTNPSFRYWDGKQYSIDPAGEQELLSDFRQTLQYATNENAEYVYTFQNNLDDITVTSKDSDKELGLVDSRKKLARRVVEDIELNNEHSTYVSDTVRSFSDGYGDWTSKDDDAAINSAVNSIKQRIRPTILALKPKLDEQGLLHEKRMFSLLPGYSYHSSVNKVVSPEDKKDYDPTFSDDWFMIDNGANQTNKYNEFLVPIDSYNDPIGDAKKRVYEHSKSLYANKVNGIVSYKTKGYKIHEIKFKQLQKSVENGIQPIEVLEFGDGTNGVKYFVNTYNDKTRSIESTAYDNLLAYIYNQYGIRIQLMVQKNYVYRIGNNFFHSINEFGEFVRANPDLANIASIEYNENKVNQQLNKK